MKKTILLLAVIVLSACAQDKAIPKHDAVATHPSGAITDSQRLRFREIERDYAQAQVVITQAEAAQSAAQAAREKQQKLQSEAQGMIKDMQASCGANQDWDGGALACKAKAVAAAPEPKK